MECLFAKEKSKAKYLYRMNMKFRWETNKLANSGFAPARDFVMEIHKNLRWLSKEELEAYK